jgi:hypothetical protein
VKRNNEKEGLDKETIVIIYDDKIISNDVIDMYCMQKQNDVYFWSILGQQNEAIKLFE